ncbi:MAG: amidohydrolase [Verrucomicrobiota bacterium]|jgi:imidazolonepropionase-like amidohydrolase
MPRFHLTFALVLATTSTLSAAQVLPAVRSATPLVLRGGTVHPVSGPDLPATDILVMNGRIAALGPQLALPAGTRVVDVAGRHVYPGLIAAHTSLGLEEIGSVSATADISEVGPINPNARAQVAVNPDNSHLAVTRFNGVLTALVVPQNRTPAGSASPLIAGHSALMQLEGWTWEDMTIRASVGLHVYWPNMTIDHRPDAKKPVVEQKKDLALKLRSIRDAFAAARAYHRAKDHGTTDTDLRWESMRAVIRGERPVFVHADELKEITAALDWAANEPGLRLILVGGLDAWRMTERLKAADIAVVLGGTHQLPLRRDDAHDSASAAAGKLHAAGVRFCIAPIDPMNDRNLPYQAAKASAHGLPAAEALKAITLYPAQILGVADELGAIEVGKRATLIVTDGDPLEIPTQVQIALVDGAVIELQSRQSELHAKYQERIRRSNEQRRGTTLIRP